MAGAREIWVKIQANVDGLMAGVGKAQQGLKNFDDDLQKSAEKRESINKIGTAFGLVGAAALAAAAVAIKSFADFDAAMSEVEATGADAAGSINELRAAALDAGARTAFSATEAANAIEELAKAGVSATDILNGGLDGALDLAAAGGLAVADAAEIAATTLQQFGLSGSDMTSVADALAAGAGKAMGSVGDLGSALSQAGLVAAQTGLSMEETTGALAAFASAGMLGSDAGTSLRSALLKLAAPSNESANLMKSLGIEAYDAQGNFVGLADLAGQLEEAFVGKTQAERDSAMATIFGSDAVRAANVLYREGEEGINGWTEAVSDQGYAADVAATRMDNLKGDIEQLGGALETAFIGTGEGADGALRGLVQNVTELVNVFNNLPSPVQSSTMTFLGLTAAVGGIGFVASRAITGFADLANTLSGLDEKMSRSQLFARGAAGLGGMAILSLAPAAGQANEKLGHLTATAGAAAMGFAVGGPMGAAIGGTVGLLGSLVTGSDSANVSLDGLRATVDGVTGSFSEASAAMVAERIIDSGTLELYEELGLTLTQVTDAALGNKDALAEVGSALEASGDSGFEAVLAWGELTEGVDKEREAAVKSTEATEQSTTGKDANAAATEELTAAIEEQTQAWLDNAEAALGQRESEIGYQEQLAETTAAIAEGARVVRDASGAIDVNAESTRNADTTLIGLARSSLDLATSMDAADISAEEINARMGASRTAFIEAAVAAGYTAQEAEGLANKYGLIPQSVATTVTAHDNASAIIAGVSSGIAGLDGDTANVYINGILSGAAGVVPSAMGNIFEAYAAGGVRREKHVPQIGRGDAIRIWNEPETKGESYIPHANDHRRPRAIQIWEQTGKILGVQQFANGGINGRIGSVAGGSKIEQHFHITAPAETNTQQLANWLAGETAFAARGSGQGGGS